MQSVRDIEIKIVEELTRPVPLEHHLYFKEYGVGTVQHIRHLRNRARQDARKRKYDPPNNKPEKALPRGFTETRLIPHLQRKKQLPCLYFCFSRKGCEENASRISVRYASTTAQ